MADKMKKSHIIKDVGDIHTWSISGEAAGSAIWTSTHVSSSGGGGYVGQYGGHVSAPRISSRTTTHKRFFIRLADGSETEIELSDSDFGVRDGHQVTAVYCQHRNDDSGWLVRLVNHQTGQKLDRRSSLPNLRGRHRKRWAFLAFPPLLFFFPIGVMTSGAWLYFFMKKRSEFRKIDSAIFARAKEEADRPHPLADAGTTISAPSEQ